MHPGGRPLGLQPLPLLLPLPCADAAADPATISAAGAAAVVQGMVGAPLASMSAVAEGFRARPAPGRELRVADAALRSPSLELPSCSSSRCRSARRSLYGPVPESTELG